ncbi:MAG: polyphosphate polymerase domain-containing protein [Oscillospiraceae bacterium]|nr:polyphosphate polymerase domain-containing protein [Oscillospiraceae bacterium]
MKFRHELKHEINLSDMITIRQRLRAATLPDPHAVDGKYFIRSLYFDNISDKALHEKLDGINQREKFRIRFYNGDTTLIHLEKKSKLNGLGSKETAELSAEQANGIANGGYAILKNLPSPLCQELYRKMKAQGLRPKTIVDYTREPFIFPAGNVRVTLDYNIRTGSNCADFLSTDCPTLPVSDAIILEVKWDEFLPDIIRDLVQLNGRQGGAFSKYAACRIYG